MMAVRNRVTLMDESIRSVLAQDDPDLELVIVDDCSDDGSWESAQAWGTAIHGSEHFGCPAPVGSQRCATGRSQRRGALPGHL